MGENIMGKSEAEAVAKIVERHIKADLISVEGGTSDAAKVLVLPSGLQAHSIKKHLDEYRTAPERREGKAHLVELQSLIDHVNRFKDLDSALFASPSPTQPTLTAVLDYHRRCHVPVDEGGEAAIVRASDERVPLRWVDGEPRFGRHRAVYPFPLSDEWKAWSGKNATAMSQGEFATWLEDRILDVVDPEQAFASAKRFAEALGIPQFASPSRLLGLSRGLSVHEASRVTNRIDPTTGEATMIYESTHQDDAGGQLSVPRAFLIRIPVFRAGVQYQLPVRLRYRVGGGKIMWFYQLHDAAKAFDDAFREACDEAAEKTALPLFYGSPEA